MVAEPEFSPAPFLAALRELLGAAQVLTRPEELAPALRDWRGRYHGDALALLRPGNTAEVAAVVRLCAAHRVAIVPQGGHTSLCGGSTPLPGGRSVVLSLSRLNRIRALDPQNNTLTAEAGCLLAEVQAAAEQAGRLFPLSLASEGSCQIGGNLSTNAGGVQVLRYGNARELCLGLEVVLPDGTIWDGLRGLRKDNTGYDLKHLFIGAEGTLGLITAAVLKLYPQPRAQVTAWIGLPSAEAALALLTASQSAFDARLTAFELVSQASLQLVQQHFPALPRPLPRAFPWYVLWELSDGGEAEPLQEAAAEFLLAQSEACGDAEVVLAASLTQAAQLWALRENISEAQKIEGVSIKHDVAVPVSRIAEFLARADAALQAAFPGLRIIAFGHMGDGNLHYNLSRADSQDNAAFIACQPQVNRIVHDLVHQLNGSISAEHGLGQLKREEIRRYKSDVEMQLMQRIKACLDPLGLMNPGKLL